MPWLYALAVTLLYAPAAFFLARHDKLRGQFARRHGRYPRRWMPSSDGPRVWWHGSSAGDILALEPIVREVRRRRPDLVCVISAMTNQGLETARRLFPDIRVTPQPFDVPWAVKGTIGAIRPHMLVVEYAELWPGLIRAASRSGARLVLTNGHLGQKKLPAYRWLFRFAGNPLRLFDRLLMRDVCERERAIALGAEPSRVHVAGNTKFDVLPGSTGIPVPLETALHPDERALLWVAGSTHEGEESVILGAFATLRVRWPALRLLIAPRYIARAAAVAELGRANGWRTRLRSESADGPADVVVLDTMGELRDAYRLASLVFVGGSFVARGGQNILEPAAWARAVVYGPHMHNFEDAVRLLSGHGGHQVEDLSGLTRLCEQLLEDDNYRANQGEQARSAVEGVRGATMRHADEILALLPPAAA